MDRLTGYLMILLLAAAPAACATTAGSGGQDQDTTTDAVYVEVENDARFDLEVSVTARGQEVRVGRVQIGDQRQFRVPAPFLNDPPYAFAVRLVARVGSNSYLTPQLTVPEGQNVYIEASPTLQSSRFSVR